MVKNFMFEFFLLIVTENYSSKRLNMNQMNVDKIPVRHLYIDSINSVIADKLSIEINHILA